LRLDGSQEISERCIPDQGVDLDGVNVVQLLESTLDLALVGLDVNDEDKGVVLLDLLHGALGVERVEDDLLGIELGLTGNGDTGVLGRPSQLKGLGAVEGGRGADLAGLVKLFPNMSVYCAMANIDLIREWYRSWNAGRTYGRSLNNCLGGSLSCR
jgi:hypothetical protein